MIMTQSTLCDYSDYDYNAKFWVNQNREYEHQLECYIVNKLLKKHASQGTSILDAGCGFGRLFTTYQSLFSEYFLVDYANNLLQQAESSIGNIDDIHFFQQSLYELKLPKQVSAIISIRTLHHLNNLPTLFQRFYEHLSNDGVMIIDIPNYYHLKNRFKFPFSSRQPMTELSPMFYNYDPKYVIQELSNAGFQILEQSPVGLFRIGIIKRVFPATWLRSIETIITIFLKRYHISPSIYVVAKKCG